MMRGACEKKMNDKKTQLAVVFVVVMGGWFLARKKNAAFELVAEVAWIFHIQSLRGMVKLSGTKDQRKNKRTSKNTTT